MALGEISPLRTVQSILKRWWILVLLGILGGVAGWFVHLIRPSLYEARAVMAFNMNFPAYTDENLSIYVADQTFGAGGALMFSSQVLEQVVAEAQRRGIDVDLSTIGKMVQYPERRQNLWSLRVRHPDPQTAADLANIWAEVSLRALEEAHSHAVKAWILRTYLQALGGCPDQSEIAAPPPPICTGQGGIDKQNLQSIEAEYNAESEASKGILSDLLFDLSQKAQVPEQPVAFETGWLVVSGALIGFSCGVVLLSIWVAPIPVDSSKKEINRTSDAA